MPRPVPTRKLDVRRYTKRQQGVFAGVPTSPVRRELPYELCQDVIYNILPVLNDQRRAQGKMRRVYFNEFMTLAVERFAHQVRSELGLKAKRYGFRARMDENAEGVEGRIQAEKGKPYLTGRVDRRRKHQGTK